MCEQLDKEDWACKVKKVQDNKWRETDTPKDHFALLQVHVAPSHKENAQLRDGKSKKVHLSLFLTN